ncbi:MAG: hypothetical protein WCK17_03480 [Verrucomicrobiota bacterium]
MNHLETPLAMHQNAAESKSRDLTPLSEQWRLPLGGCDCYLVAMEEYMASQGQGRHVGVTTLELGSGFCISSFANAVQRFGTNYPVLFASVNRSWFAGIPEWRPRPPGEIRLTVHPDGTDPKKIAAELLDGAWEGALCFDVIQCGCDVVVLMGWTHLLFDGRGAELALAEINRFAADASYGGIPLRNWGLPKMMRKSLLENLRAVRPFARRHSELRRAEVHSLGSPPSRPSGLCFQLLRFTIAETRWIGQRAEEITGGIFSLPYFLATVMRAHAEVLKVRGVSSGALECAVSAQLRKRGTSGAIFQNQVSQLFFSLPLGEVDDIRSAAAALYEQFTQMNKSGFDRAFFVMSGWMRRLPKFLYKRFINGSASGHITSFYYAHTGAFLPALKQFCSAEIVDGWHIPSVFQPPGTGVFFSERSARLTCSICWREGVVTEGEFESLITRLRADLLEGFDESTPA